MLHRRGYGLAHLEQKLPIQSDTSFCLASRSKQFTAMAVLMLAEQGLLRLEDRLRLYIPTWPGWGTEITLRHLLQHTSGLPDYISLLTSYVHGENIAAFTRDLTGVTNADVLQLMIQLTEPIFKAGEHYSYSNAGYVLLAMIVEQVSGQLFATFLKERIFAPLGMKPTRVYDASRPVVHNLAQGYIWQDDHFEPWDYPLLTAGDGGLFSTIDDLLRWDQAYIPSNS